jgi:hypothetical protein
MKISMRMNCFEVRGSDSPTTTLDVLLVWDRLVHIVTLVPGEGINLMTVVLWLLVVPE